MEEPKNSQGIDLSKPAATATAKGERGKIEAAIALQAKVPRCGCLPKKRR